MAKTGHEGRKVPTSLSPSMMRNVASTFGPIMWPFAEAWALGQIPLARGGTGAHSIRFRLTLKDPCCICNDHVAMGQKPVPAVNMPIPTKID